MTSSVFGAVPKKNVIGVRQSISYWLKLVFFFGIALVAGLYFGFSPAVQRGFYDEVLLFRPKKADEIKTSWYGREARDVMFKSSSGNMLNALFFRSPTAKRTILVSHGIEGNLNVHAKNMDNLLSDPDNEVFIYDYSGFGKSEGHPTIPIAAQDAASAYDYLINTEKIDPKRLVLYGASLGSGPAAMLASERPSAGLVLVSPYKSLKAAARENLAFLSIYPDFLLTNFDFETLANISKVHVPLLIIHGAKDKMISVGQADAIFAAANEPKQFIRPEEAGHRGFAPQDRKKILEFVRRLLP